jgi:DNA polymerase I
MLVGALKCNLNLQRYKILYICGNYSRILSRLDRKFTELEIRRAFTSFQLMTILVENHHTFLIVEHDPLLYSPALDPHLQKLTELADRVFCIYDEQAPAKGRAKAEAKTPGAQATLEAYS